MKTHRAPSYFKCQPAYFSNRNCKQKIYLTLLLFLVTASYTIAQSGISVLWQKEIEQDGRSIKPYTIQVTDDNHLRIIGLSHIPRRKDPRLVEYKIDLTDKKLELNNLIPMDQEDITILLPEAAIKDTRMIDDNIIIVRNQYNTHNLQELTIKNDCQVKTREILGLTRNSVSTHGACRSLHGNVFLCGNDGYIRMIEPDGHVAWDINYQSNKGEDGTLGVAFSESENMLVAFGMSFEPDTKFAPKSSSLWLANIDIEGHFKTKTEFNGIAGFGKSPAFCLSQSDDPIVIYDIESGLKNYNIVVSKLSRDLKSPEWATPLLRKQDIMVSKMYLSPFGEKLILAAFLCLDQQGVNPYFYILDQDGNITNQAAFEEINCVGLLLAAAQDKLFLLTEDRRYDTDPPTEFLKLICFKINLEDQYESITRSETSASLTKNIPGDLKISKRD